MKKNDEIIVPSFVTTRWNLYRPYNDQLSDKTFAIGCTAVAAGQVMRYYRHPVCAKGVLTGAPGNNYQPIDIDGYHYDWDKMPESLDVESGAELIDATSTLLYHAAISCGTAFSVGAGGQLELMAQSMINHFGFDADLFCFDMTNVKGEMHEEANELLRNEVYHSRPVIITIPKHAIICDGYLGNDIFTFNWGEGSINHTERQLEKCNPWNFYMGIRPAVTKKLSCESINISENTATLYQGDSVDTSLTLNNYSAEDFSGYIRVILSDLNGVKRAVLSEDMPVSIKSGAVATLSIPATIPVLASFGQRSIQCEYWEEDETPNRLRTASFAVTSTPVCDLARYHSSDFTLTEIVALPDVVAKDESPVAIFTIFPKKTKTAVLKLLIVDSALNSYFTIAEKTINFTENEEQQIDFELDFSTVEAADNYRLILVENHPAESKISAALHIKDVAGDGIFTLSVKPESIKYGEDVLLLSTLINEEYVHDNQYINMDVGLKGGDILSSEVATQFIYRVAMLDKDTGEVLSVSVQQNAGLIAGREITLPFRLLMPTIDAEQTFFIGIQYIPLASSGGGAFKYATSAKATVENPQEMLVVHRNVYDYIFLTKDIDISQRIFTEGETFDVSGAWIVPLPEGLMSPFFNMSAVLRDHAGEEHVVGSVLTIEGMNTVAPFTIACQIPEGLATGPFTLFLRASNLNLANIYDSSVKVQGIDEGIVDEIVITIAE